MTKRFLKQLYCTLSVAMVITSVTPTTSAVEAAKTSSLNATATTISVDGKFDINVKNQVKGTKYTYDYMYSTGKNYVTLNKKTGVVTGKKAGKATIVCTARNGKKTKILKCVITIVPKATDVKISNSEGNTLIKVGDKFQFKVTVTPSNAIKSVWSISDTSVFKVDKKNGYVRALKPGKATLTVTNGSVSDKVELTAAADYNAVQTGAKTIKITSPVMLKDSDIKVTKGSNMVPIADKGVKLSEDKLTAEILMSGRLVDGTYTITINENKKVDVTANKEKVSKIELTSDKAALTATTSSTATVGYKVLNQFGENITKSTNVQISGSHSAKGDNAGTITFEKGGSNVFNQNVDTVSVAIVHTETGITVQGTLTVSAVKAVSEVTVLDNVYNEDGKKLSGDSDLLKDDFYVLFEAKDQYGGVMSEIRLLKGNKTNENPEVFVTILGGLTKLSVDNTVYKTKKITLNGKDYAGVKLVSNDKDKTGAETGKIASGTATVNVIGAGNGKQASATITIDDGTEAVALNIYPSEVVSAGKVHELTFEATDAYGNSVTKFSTLDKILINGKKSSESQKNDGDLYFEEDYSTGNAKLKYKAPKNITTDTPVVVSLQLSNYKIVTSQFTVKPLVIPKVITKIDYNLNALNSGKSIWKSFKLDKIKVESNYGNELSFEDLKNSGYSIQAKITSVPKNPLIEVYTLRTKEANRASTVTVKFADLAKKDSIVMYLEYLIDEGLNTEECAEIEFVLLDSKGVAVPESAYTYEMYMCPINKLSSYSIADLKPIYVTSKASSTYTADGDFSIVYDVTAKYAGKTYEVSNRNVNVVGTDDVKQGVRPRYADNYLYSAKNTEFKDGVTEIKQKIKFVVNNTGETIEKEVTITNVEPKIISAESDTEYRGIKTTPICAQYLFDAKNPIQLKVKNQYYNDMDSILVGEGKVVNFNYETYNYDYIVDYTPRITFMDWSVGVDAPKQNGTKDASIELKKEGDSVLVSLDFGNKQIVKCKFFY